MSDNDWSRFDYDPMADQALLVPLIRSIISNPPKVYKDWRRILKQYPKPGGGFFSKTEIISGFRAMQSLQDWGIPESDFVSVMKMKPMRTQSGVAPVTVLTKPYPCPGQCIFCPNDVRMPKSYLSDEPGARRAMLNRFDPYGQTWNRLLAFHRMGHPIAKVELIILGGTWSSYPREYQIYFVTRCFDAINAFNASDDHRQYHAPTADHPDFLDLAPLDVDVPAEGETLNAYNHAVTKHLRSHHDGLLLSADESIQWDRLESAHEINESAACRVVGLVIETRPDEIDEVEVLHLRRLGATKVQTGIQSMSDRVLSMNRRGHDVAQSRKAVGLLRLAGFKIHAHWMANLHGATVEGDIADFGAMFSDPAIQPDELKLYPCSLIPKTELMTYFESGEWRPYNREELLHVLCEVMPQTPIYCRLSRVIRDIPSTDIHEGNQESNFREVAERTLAERGIRVMDIRAREVKLRSVADAELELRIFEYDTSVSREYFLSFETDDALLGFCRLSLPTTDAITAELKDCAMIREVHVYGQSLTIGEESGARAQHRGLGRRLMDEAAKIARTEGYGQLAVISAIGTREYYRRLGFEDGRLYQHRHLGQTT